MALNRSRNFHSQPAVLGALAVLVGLTAAPGASAGSWSISDLGANFVPVDINDRGTILPNQMTIEGKNISLRSLNNLGQAVGTDIYQNYLYANGALTTLSGIGGVGGINDVGQIVGSSCSGPYPAPCYISIWRDGVVTPKVPIGDFFGGQGLAINAAGDVAGQFFTFPGYSAPAIVSIQSVTYFPGQGSVSAGNANALNDLGQAVGSSFWGDRRCAVICATRAFLFQDGATIDLGTLGGVPYPPTTVPIDFFSIEFSQAFGINNTGQIVGKAADNRYFLGNGPATDSRAVLWLDRKIIDLSQLDAVQQGGWDSLSEAVAINELGQIVGTGFKEGVKHGFVLSPEGLSYKILAAPVPEPSTYALMLAGLALLLAKRHYSGRATRS